MFKKIFGATTMIAVLMTFSFLANVASVYGTSYVSYGLLEPGCAPTDENCTVAPPVSSSTNADFGSYNITTTGAVNSGTVVASTSISVSDGGSPAYTTKIQAGDQSGNITYTLPTASSTGVLKNNGSGTLSWGETTGTTASSATPSINTDLYSRFTITALAANITSFTTNLSGTPSDGQKLEIRILDNGVERTIAWGSSFTDRIDVLPTTTVAGKYLYVGLEYNSQASKWDCMSVGQEY